MLDLTSNVAGPYAAKLLADYGADVLKVEPPEGDPSRQFGPFYGGEPHAETSGLFLHVNTNKRSVTLDLSTADGVAEVRRLAAGADIVLEDFAPGQVDEWGIGWDALSAGRDDLVMCAITPFGQTGPYRDYRGSEITLQAIGGPMLTNGHADREPIKLGGHTAYYQAGVAIAYAVMLARLRVERGGSGDYIDLSVYECQAGSRDRRVIELTASSYTGKASKRPDSDIRLGYGVRETMDGHVALMGAGGRLPMLLTLIGREDMLANDDLYLPGAFIPEALVNEVEGSFREYLMRTTSLDFVAAAQGLGILCGAIRTVKETVEDAHFRGRGVWDTIDHPHTGPIEYPGRPIIMNGSPRVTPVHAPLLGEHNDALSGDAWLAREDEPRVESGSASGSLLPLDGVRVASITVVWAGPHTAQVLAEWGADVIRVEPTTRIQTSSRGADQSLTQEQGRQLGERGQLIAGYPDFDPKEDRWNRNPAFNSHSRNKRSMSCDITTPEGKEAFLRLIAQSDVFVENNVPETIDKAGITWEDLKKVNPRLIMIRMPGYGLDGPYKNYRTFGSHAEGMIGHHHIRNYPDAAPEFAGNALTADANAGLLAALAAVMALRHRDLTGEGQLIEIPLAEAFLPNIGEFILDYTMNGYVAPSQGNLHPHRAPHGVYATQGDDQWIVIDVGTDEEFASLCAVLGEPALAKDERFATAEARLADRASLDAAIGALTASRDKEELFHELQAAGVIATPTHNGLEALADPQLEARQWFREIDVPTVGKHRYPGYLFKMRNTADDVRLPPPLLGEHSEEIYIDLLGYSRPEYQAMVDSGLVGTAYPAEILP